MVTQVLFSASQDTIASHGFGECGAVYSALQLAAPLSLVACDVS